MINLINRTVLMSGADFFDNAAAINPYMNAATPIDRALAQHEHQQVKKAFETAGITIVQVPPPHGCQDGIYTANWAFCHGDKAVLGCLPQARRAEEAYAARVLRGLGKEVITLPDGLRFSGQGDALPCGNYLFAGSGYRTDRRVHSFLADYLGYQVIGLQTAPLTNADGTPVINSVSGWPDSYYYDIDLALAVLRPAGAGRKSLIAWCPEAFTAESQRVIRSLSDIETVDVSLTETMHAFACNLVSTGEVVVMSAHAPQLKIALQSRGLRVITPEISELTKGGGYIRCISLTIHN